MQGFELPAPLRGVIPPMVTPLAGEDQLDGAAVERLVEHMLGGGVHGLFVLGTTGEGPSLPAQLQREMLRRTCDVVGGRVPVLAGVTHSSLQESIALAEAAAAAGAQAVVAAPPFYFALGQGDVEAYFRQLARRSPLPLLLYNMPSHTKIALSPECVERLLAEPGILGIKDSAGDMTTFQHLQQIVAARPGCTLLMGPEELLGAATLAGGHGGVCGGANLLPRHFVNLQEAASSGAVETVRRLTSKTVELRRRVYDLVDQPSGFIKALKAALAHAGLCPDLPAPPLGKLDKQTTERIAVAVDDLELAPPLVGSSPGQPTGPASP